ncbi:MAG TPA: two-component regulator propeller domain-containing protein, partial [Ignavibacteria bacterium]
NKDFKKINIGGFRDSEIYCIFESKDGNIFAGSTGKIYRIKNYNVVKVIKTGFEDDKITTIMTDSRGNIWFSILSRGFYVIPAGSDKIFDIGSNLKLQKTVVNDFCEDMEGNIWVSTFGKGVFCLHNFYINNYSEEDGLSNNTVQAIEQDKNGRMILGTLNGINILEDGKYNVLEIGAKINFTDFVREMKLVNDKIYVCSSLPNYDVIKRFYKNSEFVLFQGTSFCMTKDTNYLVGGWQNQIFTNKKITNAMNEGPYFRVIGDESKNNRINKIFEDYESNLWIGTTLGLCRIKNREKKLFPENEILNSAVKSIIQDNRNKIWFAGEKGIACYNLKDSSVSSFKNISGYDLSLSTSIAVDKYDRIWIGNMNGLYILENNSVKLINMAQGLPSNEVLTLYYENEKNVMWIGTSSGFSSFDIDMFDGYKHQSLNIKIDNVEAGDSIYTKFDDLKFEPGNNDIHIMYSVFSYSSPSNLKYQYKLNNEWINTENDFLDFKSLKEGKYDVSFRAKMRDNEWSEPSNISFIIKPKFIETILFRLLIFMCFAGIVLFTAKYSINLNRKKSAEKIENSKKMFELEHQALSAMMNPHFIFNSLNSVQYLVNKGRNDEANNYIYILAKLIRKNLDIASNSFILLDEEINRLTLYLEIEKLRFQDKFSYEINAGEDVDIDSVMIPNMILQPFVENAVWYGIMNSGKKGFVKISFRFEDVNIESNLHKCLVIKITDNGIGLKKSGENKKEGHISKGIKIIEERLQLLSQELELPQPVIIEDLSLRTINSTGTEVIITLPNTLYKNISEELI